MQKIINLLSKAGSKTLVGTWFFLLAVYFCGHTVQAQDFKIMVNDRENTLPCTIEIIDSVTFEKVISHAKPETLRPKEEDFFTRNYPQIFKKDSSGYTINTVNMGELKISKSGLNEDIRDYKDYEFKGLFCNKALVYVSSYEYWEFLTINLSKGWTQKTLGEPITWDCKMAIAHSNYYTEEEISILDLEKKLEFMFTFNEWTTEEVRFSDNSFYIKIKPMGLKRNRSYIKVNVDESAPD